MKKNYFFSHLSTTESCLAHSESGEERRTVYAFLIFKVPQQSIKSNNCGIYLSMFLECYMKVRNRQLRVY